MCRQSTCFAGSRAPDTFKDKIVLVGTTALGTREVVSTPLDTLVRRRRGSGHRRRQLAAAETSSTGPSTRSRSRRRSSSAWASSRPCSSGGSASPRARRLSWRAWPLVWFGPVGADVEKRRVPVAALPDDGPDDGARGDDRRPVHQRAAAGRSGRRGQSHLAAIDGAVAALADRSPGCRDRQALEADAGSTRECSRSSCPRTRTSATI